MKVVLKVNKKKEKTNISASISHNDDNSFRSFNVTGTMISCEGFVTSDGQNFDKELVGLQVGTTVIINNQVLGEAVYEKCAEIFASRKAKGDLNPSIDLHIECATLNVKETNILISNVNSCYVNSNTSLRDNSAKVLETLNSLRKVSSNNLQTQAARINMPEISKISTLTVNTLKDRINSVKNTVKTYL